MAIPGKEDINIGLPNQALGSDSLRDAFLKTSNNFTTLFNAASQYSNFIASSGIAVTTNPVAGSVSFRNTGVTNLIAGGNITVDRANGNVTISANMDGYFGNGTVTSVGILAGPGIVVSDGQITSSGNATIENSGVISLIAGAGITLSRPNGNVTITSTAGTVTSVGVKSTTLEVTSSPVTGAGNIKVELPAFLVSNVVSSSNQPNITSVGPLTNLTVVGTADVGNLTTSGTVSVGNLNVITNTISGNVYANLGTVSGRYLAGTLTSSAQPNITSVGTLDSLLVNGNISATNSFLGNTATSNYFIGDGGYLANINGSNVVGAVPNAIYSQGAGIAFSVGGSNVSGQVANANYATYSGSAASANSVIGSHVFGEVANANYATYSGMTFRVDAPNVVGTVANANYSNFAGTAFNVNASNVSGLGTIAVINLNGSFSNVLYGNGVFAAPKTQTSLVNGSSNVVVNENGTINIGAQGSPDIFTISSTGTFINGNVSTMNVFANTGTVVASQFKGTLTTASQPYITSLGTLSALSVNGTATAVNITANTGVITGNGSGLNNIPGANVVGVVPNANLAQFASLAATANIATSATTAGTVTTAAQPNITSVGTLTSLLVNGPVAAASVNVTGVFGGNGIGITNIAGANVTGTVANATYATSAGTATSATTAGTATSATTAGTVTTAAQPNITSVGTLGNLIVSGNISGNTNGFAIGYRDIPQVVLTTSKSIEAADAGKHYYYTNNTDVTLTIPSSVTVPFKIGSTINIINQGLANINISRGAGVTLFLAGNSEPSNRVIYNFGVATITKVATDTWFITGVGIL